MPQTRTPHRPDITRVELRQICYSSQTLESLPEGMLALDYTDNERPDWREVIHRSFRIIYRVSQTTHQVEVSRFWHAARGFPHLPLMGEPPPRTPAK